MCKEEEVLLLLKRMDTDDSGSIEFDEFIEWYSTEGLERRRKLKRWERLKRWYIEWSVALQVYEVELTVNMLSLTVAQAWVG